MKDTTLSKNFNQRTRSAQMHGFYIEYRTPLAGVSLSRDLAQHIFTRSAKGAVIVVTPRPQDLASITKKQWHILIRQVQRERSSTLNRARITEMRRQLDWMKSLTFTIMSVESPPADCIIFTTLEELTKNLPVKCSTLYWMRVLNEDQIQLIAPCLKKKGVAVVYNLPKQSTT